MAQKMATIDRIWECSEARALNAWKGSHRSLGICLQEHRKKLRQRLVIRDSSDGIAKEGSHVGNLKGMRQGLALVTGKERVVRIRS